MPNPRLIHDRKLILGYSGVVGVDEAGRGCLAGPVIAGCVILPKEFFRKATNRKWIEKINDSKQFDEANREELFDRIQGSIDDGELFGETGTASVKEIEKHNIVGATCLAMQRAMEDASRKSGELWVPLPHQELGLFCENEEQSQDWQVLVDGRPMKKLVYQHHGLVKGDRISLAVAMASLLAKVTRDRLMRKLNDEFPYYGFSSNKGYGAPLHLEALKKFGPSLHHRPKFLRKLLNEAPSEESCRSGQTRLSLA